MEEQSDDTILYEDETPRLRRRGRGRGGSRSRVTSGRGRPRSRGTRGRGRGDGSRGRGQQVVSRDDRERVQERKEARKRQTQELVNSMAPDVLRQLVVELVDREPGLVFDLCQSQSDSPESRPPAPPPNTPDWCMCNNCIEMPTDLERKCCDCLPRNCVSHRLEMDTLVLDPQVLALGNGYHADMLGRHGMPVEDYNRTMRHSAYRNFTLWRHGRLGQGNRRVIPSCCVRRIRETFPDRTNTYTGFLPHRLA